MQVQCGAARGRADMYASFAGFGVTILFKQAGAACSLHSCGSMCISTAATMR